MSPTDNDTYEILGLEPGASWDEIRAAYRRLAKKHHPDKNLGDPASEWFFKQVNRAYECLRDTHRVRNEAEGPRSTRRGPDGERDREQTEPQEQARPNDPRGQAPKSATRGEEENRKDRESTGPEHARSLWSGGVPWDTISELIRTARPTIPDEWLEHWRSNLAKRYRPTGWRRVLRTAGLVLAFALVGGYLLILLSVLVGPFFGIYL